MPPYPLMFPDTFLAFLLSSACCWKRKRSFSMKIPKFLTYRLSLWNWCSTSSSVHTITKMRRVAVLGSSQWDSARLAPPTCNWFSEKWSRCCWLNYLLIDWLTNRLITRAQATNYGASFSVQRLTERSSKVRSCGGNLRIFDFFVDAVATLDFGRYQKKSGPWPLSTIRSVGDRFD